MNTKEIDAWDRCWRKHSGDCRCYDGRTTVIPATLLERIIFGMMDRKGETGRSGTGLSQWLAGKLFKN